MADVDVWNRALRSFEVHLAAMTGVPPIASPNVAYEPTTGTTFVRSTLLPAQTAIGSIGVDGTNRYQGVYQVDAFTPSGCGPAEAIALVDDIIEHFPRGLVLITDCLRIRVSQSFPASPVSEPDWYMIPVNINWFSYGDN